MDNPLTSAELEVAWRPILSVRDLTLSDQDLDRNCPLTLHRRRKKAKYGLGRLDVLPFEILNMILLHLDIQSCMSLQRTNRRGYDTVHEMPQLKAIIQHCPDVLRGILSTEMAPFIECQQLFNKLTSPTCETCNDFAGYLYLLTCTRVCFRCFTRLPNYLPILKSEACCQFGFSTTDIKRLPYLKSVPGHYTINRTSCRKRLILINTDTAQQTSTVIQGRASTIRPYGTLLAEQGVTAYTQRRAQRAEEARSRRPEAPHIKAPHDTLEYNPRRFMAIVEIPYLDLRNGRADWGICCYACRNEFGNLRHSRRQFLIAGFRQHMRQCGEVIDNEHVGATGEANDDQQKYASLLHCVRFYQMLNIIAQLFGSRGDLSPMAIYDRIQILNLEVDSENVSYYRILVDGKSFKYITIDAGVYNPKDMTWDSMIIPQLPLMPEGDWNEGHVASHPEQGTPYFSRYAKVELPTIVSIWHPVQIDWLELERAQRLRSNVCTATLKGNIGEMRAGHEVVIKFARFPWEVQYFEDETRFYERLDGQGIAPQFLGHLTEEGRVVGLVIEYIKNARHAGPEDVGECEDAMRNLHLLGMLHGDVNRHNFLVREADRRKTVTIVDFENASECTEAGVFEQEIDRLRDELHLTDGKGGYHVEIVDEDD
ncbi:uncharacterized protein Z518_08944 [Rhinocladiella mackenziei CBS 650.93]|uniref:F-box domain-containing protein n=1 Tax=Rhinocladiella mackenziei CBS 650.93 TaxID=1442369 RepID=A0A0D2I5Z0_9EURO|nr:uncharacterized protein Z518_08944 [Rhinocladiella mackenziei CBS 650.93]KIX01219.1 hypothetical protein Z518_08944 [Rhinocladiella mackenziei CBS 650.93]